MTSAPAQAPASERAVAAPAVDPNPFRARPEAGRILVGEWAEQGVTEGDWVAGLAVVEGQLAALVRSEGDTQLMLRGSSGWTLQHRHTQYEPPLEIVPRDRALVFATGELGDFVFLRAGTLEQASGRIGPCQLRSSARALAGPRDLWLVQSCRADEHHGIAARVEASRQLAEGWERIPLDGVDDHSDLEAAVDRDGAVHVLAYGEGEGDYRGELRHFVVEDGAARAVPFRGEPPASARLAVCGGRVHAAFSSDSRVALAVWDGARWLFGRDEVGPRGRIDQLVLDDACRPFLVASGLRDQENVVLSYGREGWISTPLPAHGMSRQRAIVFDGAIHVGYTRRDEGGDQRVWVASAPLGQEP